MYGISEDKLDRIHQASLAILERTGMVFQDEVILARFADHGFRVEEDRVWFRPDQVMAWIERAPAEFVLHGRNPAHSRTIGGERTVYAPAYGCPAIVDAGGEKRSAALGDYIELAKLVHQAPEMGVNGGILVEPRDVDVNYRRLLMVYAAVMLSDKPVLGIPGTVEEVSRIMALASLVFGGGEELCRRPVVMTLVNTLSPLRLDAIAAATIRTCAAYRQPVIVTPGPMAGATGPITLAGNIALAHAEAMATIAVCQILQPGMPVLYGSLPTITDMKTGAVSIGSPGFSMQSAWCAGLARLLGLPCRGGGACTDAMRVSAQSGYESMMSLMASRAGNINFVLHAAGILGGFAAFSFEQFIIDCDLIRMVEICHSGPEIDEETLALKVIEKVGPGGEFLSRRHTLRNCRKAPWLPDLSVLGGEPGGFDAKYSGKVSKRRAVLLDAYEQPEMDAALRIELETFMRALGAPGGVLEAIAGAESEEAAG